MSGRKSLERITAAAGAAVAVLLCGGTKPAPAATSFVPSIGAIAAWTDNINLLPPGQEEAGELYDVDPGFTLTHDSTREHASLTYTLHALFFSGGSSGGTHDFLHNGKLASVTQVLPDWFELDIAGQRTQGTANPAAPADTEYLFPIENIGNFTSGLVRPVLKHRFRSVQFQASYMRGISQDDYAQGQGALSYRSNESGANFTLGSVDQLARLTWDAAYQREQDKYESPYTLDYLYEQASADLGLLTVSTLRLIARGGAESNPQNGIAQGGLAASFWAGGFEWSTGPHDDLKLLVGHRYFGRSYEGHWRREARLLRLQVDYTESPTTLDAQNLQAPLAALPLVQIPGISGYSRLAPDVFLEKSLSGTAALTGRLTEVGLSLGSSEQTYYAVATPEGVVIVPRQRIFSSIIRAPVSGSITPYTQDRYRTAGLYVTRHVGPLTDVKLSGTLSKYDYSYNGSNEYTSQGFSLQLTRKLGRNSSVYLRGDHIRQYGEIAPFRMNMVSLGVNFLFGNPPVQSSPSALGYGR